MTLYSNLVSVLLLQCKRLSIPQCLGQLKECLVWVRYFFSWSNPLKSFSDTTGAIEKLSLFMLFGFRGLMNLARRPKSYLEVEFLLLLVIQILINKVSGKSSSD